MENDQNNQNRSSENVQLSSPELEQDQVSQQPKQQTPQEVPNIPKPRTPKNKYFKLIIIGFVTIFMLSVLGIGFFYLQSQRQEKVIQTPTRNQTQKASAPTQKPTIGWTTYTSEVVGIEFEYPSSWSLHESETPIPKIILTSDFYSSMTSPTSKIPYQITFYNIENKTGGKFAEYFKTLKDELFMEGVEFDEITISSHKVYKYDSPGFEYPQLFYFIPRTKNQDKYLKIQLTPDPERSNDNCELMFEILNSIVSSLKLIGN